MRASEKNKKLFICLEEYRNLVEGPKCRVDLKNTNGLLIWTLSNYKTTFDYHLGDKLKTFCYLDRFFLLVPINNSEYRRKLFLRFFELIAEDYENLIDVKRNIENIKNLFKLLRFYINSLEGSLILDFGCGTALSLNIANSYKVKIVGYDACPMMRQLAKKRGLNVWGEIDISKQRYNSLDAAFASYVLHFYPEDESLKLVFNILKPGGVFVVNIHKNQFRELIDEHLRKVGFRILNPPDLNFKKYHGPYVVYIKS